MAALVAMFGKRRPSSSKKDEFADEGPPPNTDEARVGGGGDDADDMAPPPREGDEAMPGGEEHEGHEDMAAQDLADMLGVSNDDLADFKMALKSYVSSCIAAHEAESEGETEDNY